MLMFYYWSKKYILTVQKKLRFTKEEKRRKVEFSNGCGAKSIAVDFELKKRGGFYKIMQIWDLFWKLED